MKKTAGYYRGAMDALQEVIDHLEAVYFREKAPGWEVADDIFGAIECIYTDYNVENAKRLGDWPTDSRRG